MPRRKHKQKIVPGDKVWLRAVAPQTFVGYGIIIQCPSKEHPFFLVAKNDLNSISHLLHGNFEKLEDDQQPTLEELLMSDNRYVRALGLQLLHKKTASSKLTPVTT